MNISPISFHAVKPSFRANKGYQSYYRKNDFTYDEYKELCQARDQMRDVQSLIVEFFHCKNQEKKEFLKQVIRASINSAVATLDKATLSSRIKYADTSIGVE